MSGKRPQGKERASTDGNAQSRLQPSNTQEGEKEESHAQHIELSSKNGVTGQNNHCGRPRGSWMSRKEKKKGLLKRVTGGEIPRTRQGRRSPDEENSGSTPFRIVHARERKTTWQTTKSKGKHKKKTSLSRGKGVAVGGTEAGLIRPERLSREINRRTNYSQQRGRKELGPLPAGEQRECRARPEEGKKGYCHRTAENQHHPKKGFGEGDRT